MKKEMQIANYVNQLSKDKMQMGPKSYTIKDCSRQVWIITCASNVELIKDEDEQRSKKFPTDV
ncbi:MAG: hypothetical protein U0V64_14655 [Cyclobacteriaceae bacterium]